MSPDRTCKRCSVARVNALVRAYHNDRQNGHKGRRPLSDLVRLARERGYEQARGLLSSGLNDKDLRAVCWNVSSFLEDYEVERALGEKL